MAISSKIIYVYPLTQQSTSNNFSQRHIGKTKKDIFTILILFIIAKKIENHLSVHQSGCSLINCDIVTKWNTVQLLKKECWLSLYITILSHFLVIYPGGTILGPISLSWLESEIQVTIF